MKKGLWTVCGNLNWISLWFQMCQIIHNSSQAHLQLMEEHCGTSIFSTRQERQVSGLLSEEGTERKGRVGAGARVYLHTWACEDRPGKSTHTSEPHTLSKPAWTKVNQIWWECVLHTHLSKKSKPRSRLLAFLAQSSIVLGASWLWAGDWEGSVCRWDSWTEAEGTGFSWTIGKTCQWWTLRRVSKHPVLFSNTPPRDLHCFFLAIWRYNWQSYNMFNVYTMMIC